jgi:hypothetical protein
MRPLTLEEAACLLDCEGSFCLSPKNNTIEVTVKIDMTTLGLLKAFARMFDLRVHDLGERQPHYKRLFRVQLKAKDDLRRVLRLVLPYLREKALQAEAVLEFCDLLGSRGQRLSEENRQRRMALYQRMQDLFAVKETYELTPDGYVVVDGRERSAA